MNPLEHLDQSQRAERLKAQLDVMNEGNAVAGFLNSDVWKIIERTINAQILNYRLESRDAAKNKLKEIRAYIGREEALDWLLKVIKEDFIAMAEEALKQKLQDESYYQEERQVDDQIHEQTNNPTYPGQKSGDI